MSVGRGAAVISAAASFMPFRTWSVGNVRLPRERRTIVFSDCSCRNLWQIPYFPKNMINRPNLPIVLLLSVALCFSLKAWGKAEPPAVGATKSVSNPAPRPTQKPLTSTPASAATAGSANSGGVQAGGGTTAPGSSSAAAKPGGASATAASTNAASPGVSKTPNPSGATPAPAAPVPTDADAVLRMARERLTGNHEKQSPTDITSIRARLVERVAISGRKFRLEGTYLQGTDLRL